MKYWGIAILLLIFAASSAQGQTRPEVFVFWSTNSFAPDDFQGKALPSPGSPIRATVFILNGNKPTSVSSANIKWFLDGESYKEGLALSKIDFFAPNRAGTFLKVRAQVSGVGDSVLNKTIEIPILHPQVVISAPTAGNQFSEKNLLLKARPFYFNTDSKEALSFLWKVNGQEPVPSAPPDELRLSLPNPRNGYKVQISLSASHEPENKSASAVKNLIYSK